MGTADSPSGKQEEIVYLLMSDISSR